MQNKFEELKVWRLAHSFVLKIYKIVRNFPSDEKYSLTDQIKRSASSIPTNIVEGNERQSKKEFIQFLFTAKASLAETKYHLLLARDLGYIKTVEYSELMTLSDEIGKMINGLINYLKSKI